MNLELTSRDVDLLNQSPIDRLQQGTSLFTFAYGSPNPEALFGITLRGGARWGSPQSTAAPGQGRLYLGASFDSLVGELLLNRRQQLQPKVRQGRLDSAWVWPLSANMDLSFRRIPAELLIDGQPKLVDLDGPQFGDSQRALSRIVADRGFKRDDVMGFSWHSSRTGFDLCYMLMEPWVPRAALTAGSPSRLLGTEWRGRAQAAYRAHGYTLTRNRP